MSSYLDPMLDSMQAAADPENAPGMAAYLRDQFACLGIKTPVRRALLKQFLAAYGLPPLEELPAVVEELWTLPYREYQYNGIDILRKMQKKLTPEFVPTLEWLILSKSWWDTVDLLASNMVGTIFASYPEVRQTAVQRWRASENIWLRRTTLIFQLKYRDRTDVPLLFSLIDENLTDSEFFIQKAIGWALREYSKTDAAAVRDFVGKRELSPLAHREALKWLNRQMNP